MMQTAVANIQTIDPSTGEPLERFDYTPPSDVAAKIERAVSLSARVARTKFRGTRRDSARHGAHAAIAQRRIRRHRHP